MTSNNIYIMLVFLLFWICDVQAKVEEDLPLVTAKIHVNDDSGRSLNDVEVGAGCGTFSDKGTLTDSGSSDINGNCVLKLKALCSIDVWTKKDGYYPSIAPSTNDNPRDERFYFDAFIHNGLESRASDEPAPMKKEVKLAASITLREIKNPIPLYCKRVQMDIPVRDVWLGYDFEVGDWVKPYGKGSRSDMRVRSKPKLVDPNAEYSETLLPGVASLEVDFGQDGGLVRVTNANGWLGVSEMKMPHWAPEIGYEQLPTLKIEQTTHEDSSENGKAKGYFFRTRVEREGEKIVSAHYGKLMGKINYRPVQLKEAWWGDKKKNLPAFGSLEFTYYFNPTANDRNLEYDVEKNLFKQSTQWLREP